MNTGKQRWIFHTIPHPGEFGYDTWPPDAYKISGGANAWAGLSVDPKLGMVFAATGSASFDFYGSNRIGDNLFADCVLALDARTGKRIWHFQGVHHDVWDLDFPAAPSLVTVTRNGRKVEAVAQITKTGYVYVFDRRTGEPLFPDRKPQGPAIAAGWRKARRNAAVSAEAAAVHAPDVHRRHDHQSDARSARGRARRASQARFERHVHAAQPARAPCCFPAPMAAANGAARRSTPRPALLYVNSNEQPWIIRMVTHDTTSLYNNNCASCHGADRTGTPPTFPSLVDIGQRRTRDEIAAIIREGTGRMPGFATWAAASTRSVDFLLTGKDTRIRCRAKDPNWQKYRNEGYILFRDPDGYPPLTPPWGTLNAIDLNKGEIRWQIPLRRISGAGRQGHEEHRQRQLRRSGGHRRAACCSSARRTSTRNSAPSTSCTGKLLWETVLPAAGNATPSVYEINGREYVVIVCGGGKNGAPSGGSIVAFALPK